MSGRGKKRRAEVDLEAERTLYQTFVGAANSISSLYTQAVQQQRRSAATASRQTLERLVGFLLKAEWQGSDVVPKQALFQYLQQEFEAIDGCESAPHSFPAPFLAGAAAHGPGAGAAADASAEVLIKASTSTAVAAAAAASAAAGVPRPHSAFSPSTRRGGPTATVHGPSSMDTGDGNAEFGGGAAFGFHG